MRDNLKKNTPNVKKNSIIKTEDTNPIIAFDKNNGFLAGAIK